MGLQHRERYLILAEHISNGEFAAVSIPAVLEIHLADLVRISLHQNGNPCVLQRGNRTVFVGKNGHGEDHAVILALMLFQPFGIESALIPGLHAAIAGQLRIHHNIIIASISNRFHHILPGTVNQFAGHKSTVAETKGKGHLFHLMFLLKWFQNRISPGFSQFRRASAPGGCRFPVPPSGP